MLTIQPRMRLIKDHRIRSSSWFETFRFFYVPLIKNVRLPFIRDHRTLILGIVGGTTNMATQFCEVEQLVKIRQMQTAINQQGE